MVPRVQIALRAPFHGVEPTSFAQITFLTFKRGNSVQTAYAIVHDAPAPPPPGTPGLLARVIARCLQKDPSARYADARELLHELGGARPHFRRRFASGRWIALSLAFVVAVGALSLALLLVRRGAIPADTSVVAILPFAVRGSEQYAYLGEGV